MPPSVLEHGIPELLNLGLPGLIIIALAAVVVYLYMDGRALRRDLAALYEKRTAEVAALAEKTATGLANSSATTAVQSDATAANGRLLQQILDVVRLLPASIEAAATASNSNTARILEAIGHRGRP